MNTAMEPYILFGATRPWLPPPWITTDDRVRRGASKSYLSALPDNCARFHGHLDTSTLGGAGFASQFSPLEVAGTTSNNSKNNDNHGGEDEGSWDLSAYDGIELALGEGDAKVYTLILKDEEAAGKREDGREKAGVNWEVDFEVGKEDGQEEEKEIEGGDDGTIVWVPWRDFKATFRGKEKMDAGELKTGEVRRIGLMMRSYFGKQEGDFSVVLRYITARKAKAEGEESNATTATAETLQETISQTQNHDPANQQAEQEREAGWLEWSSGVYIDRFRRGQRRFFSS